MVVAVDDTMTENRKISLKRQICTHPTNTTDSKSCTTTSTRRSTKTKAFRSSVTSPKKYTIEGKDTINVRFDPFEKEEEPVEQAAFGN